jgi:hypothetical protein
MATMPYRLFVSDKLILIDIIENYGVQNNGELNG